MATPHPSEQDFLDRDAGRKAPAGNARKAAAPQFKPTGGLLAGAGLLLLPKRRRWGQRLPDFACGLFLFGLAATLALAWFDGTGPQWPDAPCYVNAGAMIHDWMASDQLAHPYEFAKQNYSRYPGFTMPYHPPGYPAMLAVVFTLFGVSYTAARVFIACCFGVCGWLFFGLLRREGIGRLAALACAALFVTTPEMVKWSRDTMSEIPGLLFVLAASWFFRRWLTSGRRANCWLAFGLAEVAFFCRLTTAGVLPAWFLFGLLDGKWRRLLAPSPILGAVFYLMLNAAWVRFAASYCRYEVAADGRGLLFSWQNIAYFQACLPRILTAGAALLGMLGLAVGLARRRVGGATLFWACWLVSFTAFKLMTPTTLEVRHFFMAWPAFAGLACPLFAADLPTLVRRVAVPLALTAGLTAHALGIGGLPRGIVGYEPVAARLAACDQPGNVLLACKHSQELIFRFRADEPSPPRQMIRSDRCLAVRLADYAGVAAKVQAHTADDVLATVVRGRIRYLVSCAPAPGAKDRRTEEMILVDDAARAMPDRFELVDRFPALLDFGGTGQEAQVLSLWVYTGDLPSGPSEIPVTIPTADLQLSPPG